MKNAHSITKDFEAALCEYTGAPYAVAVTSCTMALTLAVAWHVQRRSYTEWLARNLPPIEIPKHTYVGVPYAIREAGGRPTFRDEDWRGMYQLLPLPVWDAARKFTSGMYMGRSERGVAKSGELPSGKRYQIEINETNDFSGHMICVSFHATKILGDTQGGAILHDNPEADAWLRRARFDGRTEGVAPAEDRFDMPRAWHCYLSPDVAARLLWHLNSLPKHNDPLPNDDYPDLSKCEAFR